jgi:hypothetical protein
MALVLDGAGPEAPDDGDGAGGEEREDVPEVGSSRWRIATGREGNGNAGEVAVPEGAVDRPAIAIGDLQDRPMEAGGDEAPVGGLRGPDGKPAGVVEEGLGDEAGGFGVVFGAELSDSVWLRTYVLVMHWRRQGDLGELSAMEWFASKGAYILVPVGHCPDYDFAAGFGERLLRVQVKTATFFRNSRWEVKVCTLGGNQSWNGLVKRFDPRRCDYLFAVVADGRRWCIPSTVIEGGRQVQLGGPKYADFEVEPGSPLPSGAVAETASTIVQLAPRGDVRAAKGDAL